VVYAGSDDDSLYAFDLAGGRATGIRPALDRLRPDYALRPDHS
jgi:hypothetical protein